MIRYLYLIVAAVLILAGIAAYRFFALTDSDIAARIEPAIPFETEVTIDQSEVSSNCVAAAFALSNSGSFGGKNPRELPDSARGLGGIWQKSPSIDEFVGTIADKYLKRDAARTLADAKRCVAELDIGQDFFGNEPVFVSQSSSGRQFILVFQKSGKDGWYFAQGR